MNDKNRKAMFAKQFKGHVGVEKEGTKLAPNVKVSIKRKPHVHNLKGYWGGWYCTTPNCTVKKYKKLKGDMKINVK